MEIHKPKPVHSGRELVSEIGVIVIGIVIALGAEQVIDRLEWHHKIQLAEEQMRLELSADDGPEVMQRLALTECIAQGLADIRASVENAKDRAVVVAAIGRLGIPRHTYDNDAYRAAEASGVLGRLDPQRLNRWYFVYSAMPVLDRIAEREYYDMAALHSIRPSGGPLSEAEQLQLLAAVESLRSDNLEVSRMAAQAVQGLKEHEVVLDGPRVRQMQTEIAQTPTFAACAAKLQSLVGAGT